jgi:hypothetical protein
MLLRQRTTRRTSRTERSKATGGKQELPDRGIDGAIGLQLDGPLCESGSNAVPQFFIFIGFDIQFE